MSKKTKKIPKELEKYEAVHVHFHKFYGWLMKKYGKDLHKRGVQTFKDPKTGKKVKFKYDNFNEYELSKRLVGFDVMEAVEKYVKKYVPEIRVVHCDDQIHSSSIILLIPHPDHGITIMFIPQNTGIQNEFFLYANHYKMLMKELRAMKAVWPKKEFELLARYR